MAGGFGWCLGVWVEWWFSTCVVSYLGVPASAGIPRLVSVIWASLVRAPFALRKGQGGSQTRPYQMAPFVLRTFPP